CAEYTPEPSQRMKWKSMSVRARLSNCTFTTIVPGFSASTLSKVQKCTHAYTKHPPTRVNSLSSFLSAVQRKGKGHLIWMEI
ncbi:unnamed protein product, partial [Ceratitis capitata]